jgi:tripartite ATP-independent transporter DctP family solute receptor
VKNKTLLVVVLLLACSFSLFAGGGSQQQAADPGSGSSGPVYPSTVLRWGTTSAEGTVVVDTMRDFAKRVAEATGGNVKVEIFPASQLGGPRELIQSTQMGALDMSMSQPAMLGDLGVKEMPILVLPYVFSSFDQRWNVLSGTIGQELLGKVSGGGIRLRGFGYFLDGARSFFTVAGKPIRKFEDAKGMKLRVQATELDNDMAIALGASPTPTSSAEMYPAMQSKIVDGAEQPLAAYYNNKFYEVSKYFTMDEHYYNTLIIIFSEISWNRLNEDTKKVLNDSWKQSFDASKDKIVANEQEMLKKIAAEGVEIITLPDREKWVNAMQPLYAKYAVAYMDLVGRIQSAK